jgi:pilus assembly protein TadC
MTRDVVAASVLVGFAALTWGDVRGVARSRLRAVSTTSSARQPATSRTAVATGAVVVLVVGVLVIRAAGRGPALAGLTPALVLVLVRHLSARAAARRRHRAVTAALPRFADLVAACLESGATPADAVDVVRRHLGGPLAVSLAPVAGALRSGVDPLAAYGNQGHDDPVRGFVAALSRAMESGAPLADTVAAIADDQRLRRRWSAEAAARRAGVHAVGPLVVCFLPAFVLLGVVPVVLGIASDVLGDLS